MCLSTMRNSPRPSSPGFNDSTKNVKERARYEPQRNLKGNDSPCGTDLSARLSFAKRAREVKAANEAAVFKEDYPRDDKSIEDDERPNRSRVSEPSRMYRKFISDAEKHGRRDVRISRVKGNLEQPSEHQNQVISDTHDDCRMSNQEEIRRKIKRKRISRGVQYDASAGRQSQTGFRFLLLNCFTSKSSGEKYNSTRKIKKREKRRNRREENDGSKNRKTKRRSPFKKLIRILTRDPKVQQDVSQCIPSTGDDFPGDKEETVDSNLQNKGASSNHEHGDDPRGESGVKIFDKTDSNDARRSASVNSDEENDVSKARRRLDSCIAGLNEIIGDACAIFAGDSGAARKNGCRTRDASDVGRRRVNF
ncbi:hypothetical protein DMN91_004519 [Ooceraea biroi]|uniref:Uncharacterized protein n=2 Tax=Ooceraea biroi TaxID=2015173 RepID=A0A3L8DPF2_OOCBI|nr:hypothetical protein DMN91_004519 [Ooceraea biroi]